MRLCVLEATPQQNQMRRTRSCCALKDVTRERWRPQLLLQPKALMSLNSERYAGMFMCITICV